jgi:hypothetical protein
MFFNELWNKEERRSLKNWLGTSNDFLIFWNKRKWKEILNEYWG